MGFGSANTEQYYTGNININYICNLARRVIKASKRRLPQYRPQATLVKATSLQVAATFLTPDL